MKRDIEKDLMEIEQAAKEQEKRDNTFTLSVLQRCHKLVSELKEYKELEEQGKLLKIPCGKVNLDLGGNKMFKVVSIKDKRITRVVYSVKTCDSSEKTEFLIYDNSTGWIWTPAEWYAPILGGTAIERH